MTVRKVVIFRHNLFRISEPFIAQQAQLLRRYRPLYLGRLRYGEPPAGAASFALQDRVRGSPLPRVIWQMLTRDTRAYRRLLEGHRPALIHAHFGVNGVYALPLARRLGIPLVTSFHGFDATLATPAFLGSPEWAQYRFRRARLARDGALFLCVSEYVRDRVVALGFPAARTRVHYIGVDTETIRPATTHRSRPTVLHVARLVEKKGTADLIAAFAAVVQRVPEAELQIVGEGPLEQRLRRQVERLGLAGAVQFLGAQPHAAVLERVAQAWVLALPSVQARSGDAEGLGMVLLEAAASGVPAVATRHGGIPEVVVDGETGRLCAEHDVGALAAALTGLLRDDGLRRRLGEAARARALRHFNLQRQCAALEDIYEDVMGGPG